MQYHYCRSSFFCALKSFQSLQAHNGNQNVGRTEAPKEAENKAKQTNIRSDCRRKNRYVPTLLSYKSLSAFSILSQNVFEDDLV